MEKTYTKEEKKEHVKLYKKSILFYSPYLIVIGLFIAELGPLLLKENQILMLPDALALLLILPITLIILEYMDQAKKFIIAVAIGSYFYLNVILKVLEYLAKVHNPIVAFGFAIVILGFVFCIILYITVMKKVLSKSKTETKIDTIQEQNNELKEGAYVIGDYFCGFKDIKSHLPCLIYFDENELKFIFINDTEKIQRSLDRKLIKSLTCRSSNKTIPSDSSYLKLDLGKFIMSRVANIPLILSLAVDTNPVSSTKVEVKVCWEVELRYMDNDKEIIFLIDVYKNPNDFVSSFNSQK
jgi:hypothetical protein